MIVTTPGTSTTAPLDDAPAGLTFTARLVDGDETLATIVTVTPRLDANGDALDAYRASFIAPAALPVAIEWLQGATVIATEIVGRALAAPVIVRVPLDGAPAGTAITARLKDGDEILSEVVTVEPMRDTAGSPIAGYIATFVQPLDLPVQLEWLQDGTTPVGLDIIGAAGLNYATVIATSKLLEGAAAGLDITAHLIDGDETLPTIVNVAAVLDASGDPLDAYLATFMLPDALPVQLVWIRDGSVEVGRDTIEAPPPKAPAFDGQVFQSGGMTQPTAADIRLWSPPLLDWQELGFPVGADPDPLQVRADQAVGELFAKTGRTLASIKTPEDVTVAQQAITLLVLLTVRNGSPAALAVMMEPWLRSMSAGSYSETRFSPAELAGTQGRGAERLGYLGPEPLATLLLMLMTEDKRADWIYLTSGRVKPAVVNIPVDFGTGLEGFGGGFGGRAWGDGISSYPGW